jgi:hypothetical protein
MPVADALGLCGNFQSTEEIVIERGGLWPIGGFWTRTDFWTRLLATMESVMQKQVKCDFDPFGLLDTRERQRHTETGKKFTTLTHTKGVPISESL